MGDECLPVARVHCAYARSGWYGRQSRKETQEVGDNPMFLYAGDYESVDDAKADLKALEELHSEHVVGTFDAAVITKDEEGKVIEKAIDEA